MAFAPDGRLFVAEQTGALRVIENGNLLPDPFATVTVDATGERGLLGVAFDPNFATNGFVYVYYTVPGDPAANVPAHNRISRFTAAGNVASGGEAPIFELDGLSAATNHNGGAIHFGPDGKLYVGVGENANGANAQSFATVLGKMLRLNADGTIPDDNPFVDTTVGKNRAIWALGLRNPYTFAFQPGTGRMFINDVGASTAEEIDDGIAGSNYGWPTCEGFCGNPSFRDPLYAYGHTGSPRACAITGGAFYNPPVAQFPSAYLGTYFFGDLCGGWIRRFDPATATATDFASGIAQPVDLAVSSTGELYYLARGAGAVYRIGATPTGVLVSSFRARREGGVVRLTWRLRDPSRVLGFHVYRGRTRLDARLLARERGSLVDRRAPRGRVTYRLEVVLVNGTRLSLSCSVRTAASPGVRAPSASPLRGRRGA
jgi:glucose/arabinose dehydrogenase